LEYTSQSSGLRCHIIRHSNIIVTRIMGVEDDRLEAGCVSQEVVQIQLIIKKYFEDARLGQSQFSCDIAFASTRLSFHSCSCGIFLRWCTYSSLHDRPAFTISIHVTLHVPRRSCCNWRNTLVSG